MLVPCTVRYRLLGTCWTRGLVWIGVGAGAGLGGESSVVGGGAGVSYVVRKVTVVSNGTCMALLRLGVVGHSSYDILAVASFVVFLG